MGGRSWGPHRCQAVLVASVAALGLTVVGVPGRSAAQLAPLTTPTTALSPVSRPPVSLPPVSLPVDVPGVTVPVDVPRVSLPPITLPPMTVPETALTPPPQAPPATEGGPRSKTFSAGTEGHPSTSTGAGAAGPAPAPLDAAGAAGGAGGSDPSVATEAVGPNRPLPLRLSRAAAQTAQDLSFPLGLALAIAAFLLVQHRVDRGDPRVASGGVLRDDDLVGFS